ncbi:DNA alkylation repair protein [bacterium]|nr:DNA alkylation repair protein [bacterium]
MKDLVKYVQQELAALADPAKAGPMAAYLKTDMPFYGVQKPDRAKIEKSMLRNFRAATRREYKQAILALWQLPHREEKYLAIHFAANHMDFVDETNLPLYKRLIQEGAWWDFVDGIATALVGVALRKEPDRVWPTMDAWIEDEDFWLRRTAILCQLGFKKETDHRRLFDYCLRRADETEFFIRKAIGWALRDYSYAEPSRVKAFLLKNKDQLSGLSFREGAKQLKKTGQLD